MSGTSAFLNVFKLPELRKKIFITLALLFVYRIGFHIPLPGTNVLVLRGVEDQISGNAVLGLMNVLSGGQLQFPVLFSLGILPYISASIIFSLLVKVIPQLEALSKEGPAGQRKINQLTRLATVPLCVIQGLILAFVQFKQLKGTVYGQNVEDFMVPLLHSDSFFTSIGAVFMIVAGLTAGTLFIMWLGEQITEYGIGNGASLIIMAGIIAALPAAAGRIISDAVENRSRILIIAVLILSYVGVVLAVVMITKGQRRIPIQQAKLMKGRRMYGGARHYLPLRVNMANVMPVIFAASLLMFPNLISNALGNREPLLSPGGWWYVTLEIILIFFFSFFWTSMMFQPQEMANNLKEHGSFVPGIRPGRKTAEYLERIMVRITLAGGAFLAVIAIIPTIVTGSLNVDWMTARFLGGTGILIVVGVALDLVDKLNAELMTRNYDGFMGSSASKKGARGGR
ncbi:MAG TPA: preprotein translocase subunit SecY [Planctomycetes bacterium]|nr:preprotein translocase subunit SecY [Planctomycetota bacterium]